MMKQKKKDEFSASTIAMVALMTALLCILSPFSIPIGPIPVSLATFVIYFSVILLGWKKGTLSCLLYLLIGFVGLPVFSGFSAGPTKLFGPTGGYLIGYLFLAVIGGWFAEKFQRKRGMCFLGMVFGTTACYIVGTVWLAYEAEMTFGLALMTGVVPFIMGDLVKIFVAIGIAPVIRGQIIKAGYIKTN